MKRILRLKAMEYRKKGMSYSEILEIVPVAKSTLSLWLKNEKLTSEQRKGLTRKRLLAAKKGAQARKKLRLYQTKVIKNSAINQVSKITEKELLLIGSALYWAEGSKEKSYRPSQNVVFSNSDSSMIKIIILWLTKSLKIDKKDLYFEIYLHESKKYLMTDIIKHWSSITGFSEALFDKIYFKKNKLGTKRKNIHESYFGLLRIKVKKSTNLNRKISGYIEGICIHCGVV